jgi:hypothetical protein
MFQTWGFLDTVDWVLSDLLTEDGRLMPIAAISRGFGQVDCEENERERRKDEFSESLGPFPLRYFNLFSTLSREKKKREVSHTELVGYLPTGALSLVHHSLFPFDIYRWTTLT